MAGPHEPPRNRSIRDLSDAQRNGFDLAAREFLALLQDSRGARAVPTGYLPIETELVLQAIRKELIRYWLPIPPTM